MSEVVEIKQYKYYTFSSRDSGSTAILFYGDSGYLGAALFNNSDDPLQDAEKFPSGVYGLHYRYSDLPGIIDMLRNEKPVYLVYNGTRNSRLSTSSEPVGEGEI